MAKKKEERPEVYFMTEDVKRFWDGAVRRLKRLGDEAGELTKRWETRAKEEVVKVSRMGKLKLDIVGLKRNREEKFRELGAKSYKLGVWRKIDQPSVKKLCQEIKKIEGDLKDKKSQVKALRKEERKPSK
ncbi:hypothetical protein KAU86_00850 [bacterium]|nr:hypothetical protein [bacterium]MCK4436477.1 hypothetical protein [bacterium]